MPSENVSASAETPGPAPAAPAATVDRRSRKRAARRDHLLDLADDLVERVGVDGLTMAALAEAADYAPASLYTYFPSRSALLAALQQRALETLAEVGREHLASWVADDVPTEQLTLARLWAFSDLFLAAPREQAREFRLQQQLFISVGAEETGDAATVVPTAMAVLDLPRRLLAEAVEVGVLEPHDDAVDPLLEPVDGDLVRTLSWVVALNGALLADRLTTGMPTTGTALGEQITAALLAGWGAPAELQEPARALADGWRRRARTDRTTTGSERRRDRR